jgi:hypothetical protein
MDGYTLCLTAEIPIKFALYYNPDRLISCFRKVRRPRLAFPEAQEGEGQGLNARRPFLNSRCFRLGVQVERHLLSEAVKKQ